MSLFSRQRPEAAPLPHEGRLPGFDGATGWLNSSPLSVDDLRGKVVLVDFWTYTCINWLRTLAYVRAWSEKYPDGLVVIGVHTPEFPFERDVDNVRWAAQEMAVTYPIALDSSYAVWDAFSNSYWPAVYIADAEGRIRHHQYGEGGYEECERVIQRLLRDAGTDETDDLATVLPVGFEVQADWANLRTPETYLGYDQAFNFASPGGAKLEQARTYAAPESLRLNQWALAGDWTVGRRAAVSDAADGRIVFRFNARDVHLVMGPRARGSSVPFQVLLDGATSGRRARPRRRRGRTRNRRAPASLPADSSERLDRGPHGRDRLPGRKRRGIRLHVRLGGDDETDSPRRGNARSAPRRDQLRRDFGAAGARCAGVLPARGATRRRNASRNVDCGRRSATSRRAPSRRGCAWDPHVRPHRNGDATTERDGRARDNRCK
jgi:thiol-disulfide isomerase/thioredoxin